MGGLGVQRALTPVLNGRGFGRRGYLGRMRVGVGVPESGVGVPGRPRVVIVYQGGLEYAYPRVGFKYLGVGLENMGGVGVPGRVRWSI